MITIVPKLKVRILRDGTEDDAYRFTGVGLTRNWGVVIGKVTESEFLVRITDSDNKVKIKRFDVERIVL